MSGEDVNPFADPSEVNPFATSSPEESQHDFSSDFNPFAVQQTTPTQPPSTTAPASASPVTPVSPVSPHQKSPTQITTPVYKPPKSPATIETTPKQFSTGRKSYGTANNDALNNKIEELEKKEADLERAQAEFDKKKDTYLHENNFPPLPKCCCVGPCFYHDISMDIPVEHQRTCKLVFYSWQLYILTMFFNMVSALAALIVDAADSGILFGVSVLYFLLFPILSFVGWYRPLYKALKIDSSFNFFLFFFIFGCQTIFMFLYSLGINRLGTCGWINGANLANGENHAVSAMFFVCAALFTLLTIINVYHLRRVHSLYRSTGASLDKAKQEFAKDVVSDTNVQKAAADAIVAGQQN